jgi:hypothetical protein
LIIKSITQKEKTLEYPKISNAQQKPHLIRKEPNYFFLFKIDIVKISLFRMNISYVVKNNSYIYVPTISRKTITL